jgi:uncharacterized protein with HEPN domain
MAPSKAPVVRLLHIVEEAKAIEDLVQGLSFDGFQGSWVFRRAVEHGLLIISEAAKTLPADIKDAAPGVAWRKVETLGNFLRHEYRDVDPELIWTIARENLPDLRKAAEVLIDKLRQTVPA